MRGMREEVKTDASCATTRSGSLDFAPSFLSDSDLAARYYSQEPAQAKLTFRLSGDS